jgi:hypothetical protein
MPTFWVGGVARDGNTNKSAPMQAIGCILNTGQDAKRKFSVNAPDFLCG